MKYTVKKNLLSNLVKYIRLPLRFIKNFFLSVINKYSNPKHISKDTVLDLLIVSTGGVATTTLINYLKLYKKVNDENDGDGYKHLNKFPLIGKKELKILYIYGNYEKIYNSLKRRDIFQFQMVKLGCPFCYLFRGLLEKFFFKFCIDRQIKEFKGRENVYVLKFENIWKNKDKLKKFLEIENDEFIKKFPLKKSN